MTDDPLDRVRDIYFGALEVSDEDRDAFLTEKCAGDASLRAEIESLLGFAPQAHEFLETPILCEHDELLGAIPTEVSDVGMRVGPYRLVSELGSGGMGTVWCAERDDDEFEREVAVKLIKRGMDTDEILRRFHNERQLLASLEHPHIARLLNGGRTEDGRPYLAMERVDGVRIDEYCVSRSVRERLDVFLQVCDAVHHAHGKLVVHRDLKPSNILVTGEGQVKLLDFGIARLLSADGQLNTAEITATRSRLLTPRYASPEQVRGETLTTASDVYSLGVILFEILTGNAPYRLTSRARDECERAVVEQTPSRPSDALSMSSESASLVPDPRKWRRALRGDLDNIVLKALRKETQRRYRSVEHLAGDIRAHLERRPVSARPDTLWYRGSKFVGRNRGFVAGTLVLMITLGAGFGFSFQAYRSESAAHRRAERQQEIAEATVGFLESMLARIKPSTALGRDVTLLREILDDAATQLDGELGTRPEVTERIAFTVASVYSAIGNPEQAELFARRALEAAIAVHGEDHLRVAATRSLLGQALSGRGKFAEAIELQRVALATRERVGSPDSIASSLNELGLVLKHDGKYEEAEARYRQSLEHMGQASVEATYVMHNLSMLLRTRGKRREASELLEKVVAIRREKLPRDHFSQSVSLQALSSLKGSRGQLREAIELGEEAVRIQRKVLDSSHPLLAAGLQNCANAYARSGELEESYVRGREAVAILRNAHDGDHPETARAISNLAVNLARKKAHRPEAVTLQREALAMRRRIYPEGHADTAVSLEGLAGILLNETSSVEIRELYEEALAIRRRVFSPEHPLVAMSLHNIAYYLYRNGDLAEAEALARQALEMRKAVLRPNDSSTALTHFVLGRILLDADKLADGEQSLRSAVEMYHAFYGESHSYTARARTYWGLALVLLNRLDDAERELNSGLAILRERTGATSGWTLEAESFLARLAEARRGGTAP